MNTPVKLNKAYMEVTSIEIRTSTLRKWVDQAREDIVKKAQRLKKSIEINNWEG